MKNGACEHCGKVDCVGSQCQLKYQKAERDPNGIDAKAPGSKMDAGKAPVRRGLLEYFPRACMAVALVSAAGAQKYTWGGWQSVPDGVNRYGDAEVRHICKAAIEGPVDPDFEYLHAAHEAWNAMARLELTLREREGAINIPVTREGEPPRPVAVPRRPVAVSWGEDPGDITKT